MNSAVFSKSMKYRYTLTRSLDGFRRDCDRLSCLFICLNPSTADAVVDDPTVRRCIGFCRRWGYAELTVCNIFALRSTDPKLLYRSDDPIGPLNNRHLRHEAARHELIVAAWGNHGLLDARGDHVLEMLAARVDCVHVLALNKSGQPQHPLYMHADSVPIPL